MGDIDTAYCCATRLYEKWVRDPQSRLAGADSKPP